MPPAFKLYNIMYLYYFELLEHTQFYGELQQLITKKRKLNEELGDQELRKVCCAKGHNT